jgi:hypothetical protein
LTVKKKTTANMLADNGKPAIAMKVQTEFHFPNAGAIETSPPLTERLPGLSAGQAESSLTRR